MPTDTWKFSSETEKLEEFKNEVGSASIRETIKTPEVTRNE